MVKDIATLSELSQAIEASTNRLTAIAAELKATHFSLTLPDVVKVANTILIILFWLAIFFALTAYANCQLWHFAEVWKIV